MIAAPEALLSCRRCPRLTAHREEIARRKRRAYREETYWGKPVPGFGDADARIVVLGLAPGAHGSNRTGRMFTGDASGDFLFPALWRAGLADRPTAVDRHDGLQLHHTWITAVARCVPPGNKPTRSEVASCRDWLAYDLGRLAAARVVVALGAIAHDGYLELLKARGAHLVKSRFAFRHGRLHRFDDVVGGAGFVPLLDAYHVSFQNTNTGRLTKQMFDDVLARARELAGLGAFRRSEHLAEGGPRASGTRDSGDDSASP